MINEEKERQRKIYDSLGSRYAGDQWSVQFSDVDINYLKDYKNYQQFKKLGLKKNVKVLDVGCNDATVLNRLSFKYEIKGWGIDLSRAAINYGKSKNTYNHILLVGDAEDIPFKDNFFDAVVSLDVFEHLPNPALALAEIYRTLKPGRKALVYSISKKNKYTWHSFLRFISKNKIGIDNSGGHKQEMFISPEDFKKWSTDSNFEVLDVAYFHAFFTLAYDEYISPTIARGIYLVEKLTSSKRIKLFYVKFAIPVIIKILSFLDLPWKICGYSNGFYVLLLKRGKINK